MTQRRRFFPSAAVQTVPGASVEVGVRLQKVGAVVAASVAPPVVPDPPEGYCTGWISQVLSFAPPHAYAVNVLPDGRTEIQGVLDEIGEADYRGLVSSMWEGVPALLDGEGRALPVPSDTFVCVEMSIDVGRAELLPGMQFMALAPACTWLPEWDSPSEEDPLVSASGHVVTVAGSTLLVQAINPGFGDLPVETLTAQAFFGAVQVAQISFSAHRVGE
ncbi:hypothetical protein [Acidovorax sp. BL-A-41-H1]|uniref:hypothetical protein n=1 Tax=Acidovorax sp. BL-A-41-H1 TaxID=3421102 RepID=UPI003F7AA528